MKQADLLDFLRVYQKELNDLVNKFKEGKESIDKNHKRKLNWKKFYHYLFSLRVIFGITAFIITPFIAVGFGTIFGDETVYGNLWAALLELPLPVLAVCMILPLVIIVWGLYSFSSHVVGLEISNIENNAFTKELYEKYNPLEYKILTALSNEKDYVHDATLKVKECVLRNSDESIERERQVHRDTAKRLEKTKEIDSDLEEALEDKTALLAEIDFLHLLLDLIHRNVIHFIENGYAVSNAELNAKFSFYKREQNDTDTFEYRLRHGVSKSKISADIIQFEGENLDHLRQGEILIQSEEKTAIWLMTLDDRSDWLVKLHEKRHVDNLLNGNDQGIITVEGYRKLLLVLFELIGSDKI
ncbi:hypothetical protein [Natribacillus halophilus]|uniref:Uncharacterized protein n=1 Tax=Natribacillus halophilus TaxID=549003 RepID=A0A1G8KEV1_9BACI|nr:hypothetical protein [Natribacillus halophilus]SDI41926.1 hypothetical protein SAMN04488123_10261 [Natribacillus halophilus]